MRTKQITVRLLVTALAMAVLGVAFGASSAMAVLEKPKECPGATSIKGKGSSLQKIAQQNVWDSGAKGFNLIESPGGVLGCKLHGTPEEPKVEYTSTGSGPGLEAWGVGNTKKVSASEDEFIGTDDAPNKEQLEAIDTAANSTGVSDVAVIPVLQAAIAIPVHPPANCAVKENKITNSALQKIWSGETVKWSEIKRGAVSGVEEKVANACVVEIKRIVRKEGSGTTYQVKHYFAEIQEQPCVKAGVKKWTEYQPLKESMNWPECGSIPAEKNGEGGGGEAKYVAEHANTIGYANLADARGQAGKAGYTWLKVENEHTKTFLAPGTSTTPAEPGSTEVSTSNCAETEYTNLSGHQTEAKGLNFDWSNVYGGHPGGSGPINANYPICTLTWDLALHNYVNAGFTKGQFITTNDFFKYVIGEQGKANLEGGQEAIREKHDYQSLPTFAINIYEIAEGVRTQIHE